MIRGEDDLGDVRTINPAFMTFPKLPNGGVLNHEAFPATIPTLFGGNEFTRAKPTVTPDSRPSGDKSDDHRYKINPVASQPTNQCRHRSNPDAHPHRPDPQAPARGMCFQDALLNVFTERLKI